MFYSQLKKKLRLSLWLTFSKIFTVVDYSVPANFEAALYGFCDDIYKQAGAGVVPSSGLARS